jgi:hypothetical protein
MREMQKIKASEIKPGMVIRTATDDRFDIEKVTVKWGAVQVRDHCEWRGLGLNEPVTVLGHFNPED